MEVGEKRIRPARRVGGKVGGREDHAVHAEELFGERTAIDGCGPLVRQHLHGCDEAGLHEQLTRLQQLPLGSEDLAAALERENVLEHREGAPVHLRERDTAAREVERGLHEPFPGQPTESCGELPERRRKAGNRTRAGPDRVDDDLVSEGYGHVQEIAGARRQRREAVDVRHPGAVEDDRMTPGEKAAHDRLGDAGGQSHGHDGVGRRSALGEDLGSDRGGRGMACCNSRHLHAPHPAPSDTAVTRLFLRLLAFRRPRSRLRRVTSFTRGGERGMSTRGAP